MLLRYRPLNQALCHTRMFRPLQKVTAQPAPFRPPHHRSFHSHTSHQLMRTHSQTSTFRQQSHSVSTRPPRTNKTRITHPSRQPHPNLPPLHRHSLTQLRRPLKLHLPSTRGDDPAAPLAGLTNRMQRHRSLPTSTRASRNGALCSGSSRVRSRNRLVQNLHMTEHTMWPVAEHMLLCPPSTLCSADMTRMTQNSRLASRSNPHRGTAEMPDVVCTLPHEAPYERLMISAYLQGSGPSPLPSCRTPRVVWSLRNVAGLPQQASGLREATPNELQRFADVYRPATRDAKEKQRRRAASIARPRAARRCAAPSAQTSLGAAVYTNRGASNLAHAERARVDRGTVITTNRVHPDS